MWSQLGGTAAEFEQWNESKWKFKGKYHLKNVPKKVNFFDLQLLKKIGKKIVKYTEAMIISLPAPDGPPIIDTTRLGVIAISLVNKFLNHVFILRSKNPYIIHTKI